MQVSINAQTGKTILVRCLCAAYNSIRVTFPVDAVIIAFDGRALGVPPFARYNHAFLLPAGTPFFLSTARRFDALLRSNTPVNSFATVQFYDNRGVADFHGSTIPLDPQPALLKTARIPIVIQ
jgi:hypothetical protein